MRYCTLSDTFLVDITYECMCRHLTSNSAIYIFIFIFFTVYIYIYIYIYIEREREREREREIHSSVVFLYSFKMIL